MPIKRPLPIARKHQKPAMANAMERSKKMALDVLLIPNLVKDQPMKSITETFNGLPIVFREDGYINMTKAAKVFKKQLIHFWSNDETGEYLVHLASSMKLIHRVSDEIDSWDVLGAKEALVETRKGRYGGTFCHPKLAIKFARWLSVEFEVWCDLMIDNILRGNIQTSVVVPTQGPRYRVMC